MPIVDGKYLSPIWSNDSGQKLNASEMQAITDTIQRNQDYKIEKVTGALSGNFPIFGSDGAITDSGLSKQYTIGSFAGLRTRIDALYKLTQGQIWDVQTDSTAAYSKTVPSGAVAAEISSIGGNTVVWNQLNRNNASSEAAAGVSFTKNDDGSWSAVGTATENASKNLAAYSSGSLGIAGHKYLVYSGLSISTYVSADGSISYMTESLVNNGSTVFTLPDNKDGSKLVMIFRTVGDRAYDTSGYAFFCDLTVMFGAGNEPADNTDPRVPGIIKYAISHLVFDEGSPQHAAVTDVVSKHKEVVWNQIIRNDASSETINGVTFTKNGTTWTVNGTATERAVKAVSNYTRVEGNKYLYTGCPDGGSLETYHLTNDVGNGYVSTADSTTGVNVSIVVEAGTTVSNLVFTPAVIGLTKMFGAGREPTDTSDPRIAGIIAYAEAHPEYSAGQIIAQTTVGGQVVFTTDITVATLDIPDAVRALEGYGQSEVGGDGNVLDLADGTYTEIGHYVDGVWTALAEPVVTDVSAMLPDNMLDTEAGGTLTFRQEGIAPYLNVASRVEYSSGAGTPVALPAGTKANFGHKLYFSARAISADGVKAQSVSFQRVNSGGTGFVFWLGGNTDGSGFVHAYWDGNYDAETVVYTSDGTTSVSADNIRLSVGPPASGATPPVAYRLDGVRMLDLTEIFGKGNEPTSLSDTKLTALIGVTELPVPSGVDYVVKLSEVNA